MTPFRFLPVKVGFVPIVKSSRASSVSGLKLPETERLPGHYLHNMDFQSSLALQSQRHSLDRLLKRPSPLQRMARLARTIWTIRQSGVCFVIYFLDAPIVKSSLGLGRKAASGAASGAGLVAH